MSNLLVLGVDVRRCTSAAWTSAVVASAFMSSVAVAQSGPPVVDPAPEQRRQQERERAARERQEPRVDVQTPVTPVVQTRLLAAEKPCFDINKISLSGDAAGSFDWALDALSGPQNDDSPMGKCLGAQSVNTLLQRAQDAVIARGFVTSRILAAPQDLSSGRLDLTVVPGRVLAVRFTPASSSRGTEYNAVPIKSGDLLNLRDIEQALENFKRVPTAEVDIQIEPATEADGQSAQPGQSDLVISYQQTLPFRISLSADDGGSKATGKIQGGLTVSYDNWLTLNDLLYVSVNQDIGGRLPGQRGTNSLTMHYSLPFGYWLLSATASKNRYNQTVAGFSQSYNYSGKSSNGEIKLARVIYRDAVRKTTASIRAFQRTSNNSIDDTEIEVQRRVVGGYELGLSHREFIGAGSLDASLTHKRGTGAFNSAPAPEEAFGEGTSRLRVSAFDVTLNAPFKISDQRFRYTGSLRGQVNHTALTPQDRFAIGGRYTVRGFDGESSLSAERGLVLRNDLSISLGGSGQELYVGVDYGKVKGPSSEFLVGKSLSGMVLGARGGVKGVQFDVFVGKPLNKPENFGTYKTAAGFSLNYSF